MVTNVLVPSTIGIPIEFDLIGELVQVNERERFDCIEDDGLKYFSGLFFME